MVVRAATPEMHLPVARRIVTQRAGDVEQAARRLLASAGLHGIDFGLSFCTREPFGGRATSWRVREACLAVLGAGRTAMMFVSEPMKGEGDRPGERASCVMAACAYLAQESPRRAALAQGLPDPAEPWAVRAYQDAGFISVGELLYMRSDLTRMAMSDARWTVDLQPGVKVRRMSEMTTAESDAALAAALERTYIQTLDCPELCGLRATRDVIGSHRSVGVYDPGLWTLVEAEGEPEGCVLLSRCPESRTIELVYLGLGPKLRGKGLGLALLGSAMADLARSHAGWSVTCAVDARNGPARRVYGKLGFEAFARRLAFVKPLE